MSQNERREYDSYHSVQPAGTCYSPLSIVSWLIDSNVKRIPKTCQVFILVCSQDHLHLFLSHLDGDTMIPQNVDKLKLVTQQLSRCFSDYTHSLGLPDQH